MKFFIPGLTDEREAREAWDSLRRRSGRETMERPVRALTFTHDGEQYVAEVGTSRVRASTGLEDPTEIVAIIEADDLFFVWQEPGRSRWANPAMVGKTSAEKVEYFDE